MKRIIAVIMIIGLLCSAFAEVSRPSLDGRAKVAEVGELPVGLFAKSASFLPGDTVIVTNPATKISIEVMIFGNIGSSEGIAVVLSPEAARELYITKGSNVIVQVTKKSDTYAESSILAKTLQTYSPEEAVEESEVDPESEEPVFDTPSEAGDEEYVFYQVEDEEPAELVEVEPEPVEPVEEVAFEEPEWPVEVVEVEPEPLEPVEEVAFEEPEWPAEVVEVEPEPLEPAEEVAFEEPEWPEEPVLEEESEIVYVEAMDDQPVEEEIEEEPVIEYVEIVEEPEVAEVVEEEPVEELPEENENFIEETEIALIPADPNPPVYEDIIQDEPEVVIIPIFEESSELAQDDQVNTEVDVETEDIIEIVPVIVEEPEVSWADIPAVEEIEQEPMIEPEPVVIVPEPVASVTIPYGEIKAGNWYIQIATCSKLESVENIVNQYGKKYPLVVVKLDSGDMRVLVGSLSSDEYPTILARFKAFGFKDAFARSK